MQPGSAFVYEKKCAWCGKHFGVLHTDLWAYKINGTFYCSWKCLRAQEKSKGELRHMGGKPQILNKEQKEKALQLALKGYSPINYIRECGSQNPLNQWAVIRSVIRDKDPETFAKLPKTIKGLPNPPESGAEEEPETEDPDPADEKPEEPKICRPVNYDGFEFGSAKSTETGFKYEYSKEYDLFCIKAKGDELALCLEDMRKMVHELPRAARVLGVEL